MEQLHRGTDAEQQEQDDAHHEAFVEAVSGDEHEDADERQEDTRERQPPREEPERAVEPAPDETGE